MDPFIGEIRIFAGNFAPYGWAFCDGRILPIAQNTALFSLLGTYYGGDGRTTFALPDLRGRVPLHQGAGPGLTPRSIGQAGGTAAETLIQSEMPFHTHVAYAKAEGGGAGTPQNNVWAETVGEGRGGDQIPLYASQPNTTLSPQALAVAGGSMPHNNMQPYLGVNYIIATQGLFPPRS